VNAILHDATGAVHSLTANDCNHWPMMAGQWTSQRFFAQVPAKPVNKTGAGSTVCRDHDAAEPAKEHD
jgi:hypothetical protein